MDNPGEILRLCRLCLVKDQVNIPIFEEGDIRQIFLKISSCLPVKVSSDDKLPKKICDGCSNKLDLFYEFWNTSANAEKTLLSWLGQAGVKDADETISAVAQQIAKPAETQVKQEALEDGHANQVQDSFTSQSFEEEAKDESEAPPPKRARRTAAVKAQINITPESDDDDDMDNAEAMTKVEDESEESDGEDKDPSYSEVPGTSADNQAGPSGVGKDGVEAPSKFECLGLTSCSHHTKNFKCNFLTEHDIYEFQSAFYANPTKIDQDNFIIKCCQVQKPKRRRPKNNNNSPKQLSNKFFVLKQNGDRIPVCRTAFTNILCVSKDRVNGVLKRFLLSNGALAKENRGGDRTSHKSENVRQAMQVFLESLKCSVMHHCSAAGIVYLPPELNIRMLYKMFRSTIDDDNVQVKEAFFRREFVIKYKESFGTPQTNVCSSCLQLNEEIKTPDDAKKKN